MSPNICSLARDLNIEPVLATMGNVMEAMCILDVVTCFDTLPVLWRKSGGYDGGSVGWLVRERKFSNILFTLIVRLRRMKRTAW